MTVHVVIPARGGSKGVPGKNLQVVGRRSLLGNCILTAQDAFPDMTPWVNTDDQVIAEQAGMYNAYVFRRPERLSRDETAEDEVLCHMARKLKWPKDDLLLVLHCTNPFSTYSDAKVVVELLEHQPLANSAVTMVPWSRFIWSHTPHCNQGFIHQTLPHGRPRRQDMMPMYRETGGACATRVGSLLQSGCRVNPPTLPCVVTERAALDIDEPMELDYARFIAKVSP